MIRRPMLAAALLGVMALAGCASSGPPLATVPNIDLERYAGRWYDIANIPYFAERGMVGSYFDISFSGSDLKDVYTGAQDSFSAKPEHFTMSGYVIPESGNARWRESPMWPIYFSYLILYVDPEYKVALVGYPGRNYGWILARTPDIDDATYQSLLNRMHGFGYDTSLFRRVPQRPDQMSQPGFQ